MKFHIPFIALALSSAVPHYAFAEGLQDELAAVETQIKAVDEEISKYQSGLIRTLAEARKHALELSRVVIQNRIAAENGEAQIEITVPAVQPDEVKAAQLLGEMADAQKRVEQAEAEAAQGGGLIQALALSRAETEKLTLAQLEMAYLQAKYGIAFPVSAPSDDASSANAAQGDAAPADASDGSTSSTTAPVAWADPKHPEIDYSLSQFALAHADGQKISGWWTIRSEKAAVDDSPQVTAINYSAVVPGAFGDITALIARCVEGETAVIFVQDDFIMDDYQTHMLDMVVRIDDAPAEQMRWSSLTSNQGAGLFGRDAEAYLRKVYDAGQLFVRLTENNGNKHDAKFTLAGQQDAIEAVAAACGWSTLTLSTDDYKAIQTLLNAGGFDTGVPDGQWGAGSQKAMKAYQASVGLPETGAPDRATLEKLGVAK